MRMPSAPATTLTRRGKSTRANVSLDKTLLAEAKELGVNVSQASNHGLEQAVKKARAERWLNENREALDSYNAWVEANGLPLSKYRLF